MKFMSFKNKRSQRMYVLHNNSGMFATVVLFTFSVVVIDVRAAWDY
jgi:hypothetical protein